MQFFIDTATNKVYAFENDVVITGSVGSFVFTAPNGQVLGPYPSTLEPFTPPTPTAEQNAAIANQQLSVTGYNTAIAQGIAVTSSNTATLNATYACDPQTCSDMMAEVQYISIFGEFTNQGSTDIWPDITGNVHVFPSTTEFIALAKGQAQYVAICKMVSGQIAMGQTVSFPSNSVNIP
jgi:hypothetical protein